MPEKEIDIEVGDGPEGEEEPEGEEAAKRKLENDTPIAESAGEAPAEDSSKEEPTNSQDKDANKEQPPTAKDA